MNNQFDKTVDIEEIAEMAQRGEDVSEYFTGRHVAKQQISVDFPPPLLRLIDAECQRLGMNRQDWIRIICAEQLKVRQDNHQPHALPLAAVLSY